MQDMTGHELGRYHLLEKLGEGGMATVYKAYDTRLERDVAVKVIRREAFSQEVLERVLKRFEREAKTLAKLTHPNIVSIIDYGDQEGSPYLVMPYLPGGTLKQFLGKPMPWQNAVMLLLPVAKALAYAHGLDIIHRDVKPANILITASGEPMLTDFGIAKMLDLQGGQTLTGTGVGVGTPEYMAPEQGLGKEVDGRSDIYSLGIVLYELITGHKPYTADTPMAVVFKHMTDPLPRIKDFIKGVPETIEYIILKSLAKEPRFRYQSMTELISAMTGFYKDPSKLPKFGKDQEENRSPKKPNSFLDNSSIVDTVQDKFNFYQETIVPLKKRRNNKLLMVMGASILFLIFIILGIFPNWFVKTKPQLNSQSTTPTMARMETPASNAPSTIPTSDEQTLTCSMADTENDAQPGYYDLTSGEILFSNSLLQVSLTLREGLPNPFPINNENSPMGSNLNDWGVWIDIDGDPTTGTSFRPSYDQRSEEASGIEYEITLGNWKTSQDNMLTNNPENLFTPRLLKWVGNSGNLVSTPTFTISNENRTLKLTTELNNITSKTKFYFRTTCMNQNCDYSANFDAGYDVKCQFREQQQSQNEYLLINLRINGVYDGVIKYDPGLNKVTPFFEKGSQVLATSPDGKYVLFIKDDQLFIFTSDSNNKQQVPKITGAIESSVWINETHQFLLKDYSNQYILVDPSTISVNYILDPIRYEYYLMNSNTGNLDYQEKISPDGNLTMTYNSNGTTIFDNTSSNVVVACGIESIDPSMSKLAEEGWKRCVPAIWSPDSKFIAVYLLSETRYKNIILSKDGTMIAETSCIGSPYTWSSDSNFMFYGFGRYGIEKCNAKTGENILTNSYVVSNDEQSTFNSFYVIP